LGQICTCESLKKGSAATFTPTNLDENATPKQRKMWKIRANNTIKCEELLEVNLEAIYEVLCPSVY